MNDDRVGRGLDELFAADRASMCTALSLATIDRFAIALDELHDDSTSIALYGAYAKATGAPRAHRSPARPARGVDLDEHGDDSSTLTMADGRAVAARACRVRVGAPAAAVIAV